MVSYFVRYRGQAADSAAFTGYYAQNHAAILKRIPEIRSLVLHTPLTSGDPFPVNPGGSLLLAQMIFDNPKALDAALRSDARRDARDDFSRFPAFEAEVTHEAMVARVIF